jgi:hypothetical protein
MEMLYASELHDPFVGRRQYRKEKHDRYQNKEKKMSAGQKGWLFQMGQAGPRMITGKGLAAMTERESRICRRVLVKNSTGEFKEKHRL